MIGSNAETGRWNAITEWIGALILVIISATTAGELRAEIGEVLSHQKISSEEGNFIDTLDDVDSFGSSIAPLGDLDGDGVADFAVGASGDADGGIKFHGAIWVIFPNSDGSVKASRKISATKGNFPDNLDFGVGLAGSLDSMGDFDGDGVVDIVAGASHDNDGGHFRGAIWILHLNSDGTVKAYSKISDTAGGFAGGLDDEDYFGSDVAAIGDLDGDGVCDLAVGAQGDDGSAAAPDANRGAIYILFLNSDGTVRTYQKIGDAAGNFSGTLDDDDYFGSSVAAIGDLDGDGVGDLAVGAALDHDGGEDRGAVWVLFLNSDGTVKAQQKISDTEGNFSGELINIANFGTSVAPLGDFDGDGAVDIVVGAYYQDPRRTGAVWILFLNRDGTVKTDQKIGDGAGNFTGFLPNYAGFGSAVAPAGDFDGDGTADLMVGSGGDIDGGRERGAVWFLFLNSDGTVKSHTKISELSDNFEGTLDDRDYFGTGVASLGDLDGDGVGDLAVGAEQDDDGWEWIWEADQTDRGAVWVLFLNNDGTVKNYQKISDTHGGFTGTLIDQDAFGRAVAPLGDLDGDGIIDLAVGATGLGSEHNERGAVWVLFLHSDGTVKAHQKISDTEGSFTGTLDDGDRFGAGITALGDLDGDGIGDIAVGAYNDDDGGTDHGAVWVLFLNGDGTVKVHQKISSSEGNFTGTLGADTFGRSLGYLGDLDGDGVGDLAVGAASDDKDGYNHGAVWVLFLNSDGTVKAHQKISSSEGGFAGPLNDGDFFGCSLASLGDVDGDGIVDIAVGAFFDGAMWILFLNRDGTVKGHRKISDTEGNLTGVLDGGDCFGFSAASLGDFDADGTVDLAVGAIYDDDGGNDHGAVWLLSLESEVAPVGVHLDIKPGSCPNLLNINVPNGEKANGGVLPVAILGSDELDVRDIDVSSLGLAGASPLRHSFKDVATPSSGEDDCACSEVGPDGYTDLELKFRRLDVVAGLGKVSGRGVTVTLTGQLKDGTPIEGTDCVRIVPKKGDTGPQLASTGAPAVTALGPATPNPFNPITTIGYELAERGHVTLNVYDVTGTLVATLVDSEMPGGRHEVTWEARSVSSGVYFYRMQAGDFVQTRKMILLK